MPVWSASVTAGSRARDRLAAHAASSFCSSLSERAFPTSLLTGSILTSRLKIRPQTMAFEQRPEGAEFKINRLRRSSLTEPSLLVVSDVVGRDVDKRRSDPSTGLRCLSILITSIRYDFAASVVFSA